MTDVCDINSELIISIIKTFDTYSIIKVLGICSINRNDNFIPQILSPPYIIWINFFRNLICLLYYLFRKIYRDTVLINNGKNINSRIIFMTQNLNNFSFCTFSSFRIFSNACKYFMTVDSSMCMSLRNKNIIWNPLIISNNKTKGTVILKCTDNGNYCTL